MNVSVLKMYHMFLIKKKKQLISKLFLGRTSDYYIPRSIQYQSQEYVVTIILPYSSGYKVKSFQFAPDSALKTIKEFLFHQVSLISKKDGVIV